MLTPGFVTDLLALALLLPPTRALVRRSLVGGVAKRMMGPAAIPGGMAFRYADARRPRPAPADDVVDGTAHDVDPRELR